LRYGEYLYINLRYVYNLSLYSVFAIKPKAKKKKSRIFMLFYILKINTTIFILSEGLLPPIVTILRFMVMSLICVSATLLSPIMVQIREVWVPINGVMFIPDFLKFGYIMFKLGTQSKENAYRQARARTHTPRLSLKPPFIFKNLNFLRNAYIPGILY
jgi:hypothetical protein